MARIALLFVAIMSFGGALSSASAQEASTSPFAWRVESRFRLWDKAQAAPGMLSPDQLLEEIAGERAPDLVYDRIRDFLRQQPNLHRNAYWLASEEQYGLGYLFPQSYTVQVGLIDNTGLAGRNCVWTSMVGRFERAVVPCDRSARLTLPAASDGTGSAIAQISVQPDGEAPPISGSLQVKDRLIAGIGDSFASGEGNPDRPSDFGVLSSGLGARYEAEWGEERWLGRTNAVRGFQPADWWDGRCHRSFNSQQVTAALKYAADHPHEAVTFLSYACSGAHVLQGLLVTQTQPPGYNDSPNALPLRLPQVEALARNLCRPDSVGQSQAADLGVRNYRKLEIANNGSHKEVQVSAVLGGCRPGAQRRKVDAVLLAIGGNDIGFAPVIFDGLLPKRASDPIGKVILDQMRDRTTRTPGTANAYIRFALPDGLDLLRRRINEAFPEVRQVLQIEYPSPLYSETGELCGPANENDEASRQHPHRRRLTALAGIWPDRTVEPPKRWQLSIDQREGAQVRELVVEPLNRTIQTFDQGAGWTYVSGYAPVFATRGWCASDGRQDLAEFPLWSSSTNSWSNWNPAQWTPYARRARLFRTPNDTAFTEAMEHPRRVLGQASVIVSPWFEERQEGLMYSNAGAFHPTAEAHVVMGLAVSRYIQLP